MDGIRAMRILVALVASLLVFPWVSALAQRAVPSGVLRPRVHATTSVHSIGGDSASRHVSPWPIIIGTATGATVGWAMGHFWQGQCETPPCVSRTANYDSDGLLIGAALGLVTGVIVAVLRSGPESR